MPYIDKKDRVKLNSSMIDLIARNHSPSTSGELNYCLTLIVDAFVKHKGSNYEAYNSVIGVLECCKLEYYRRRVSTYEDTKIFSNGDVF